MSAGDAVYVPILPSFDRFFSETSKNSKKAGSQAGDAFSSGLESGVKKAEKAVESASNAAKRASDSATDATNKRKIAEQKLAETLDKGTASASQIMSATEAYRRAQVKEESAARASEKAAEGLTKAKRELKSASDEAGDASRVAGGDVDSFGDSAKGAAGKITELVGAAAGIAGAFEAVQSGMEFSGEVGKISRQLGMTGDAAAALGDQVSSVMKSGVAGSVEEAAKAVGDLHSAIGWLGSEGERSAEDLARPLLAFTDTFEADTEEAVQTVSQLLNSGLASNATEAFDLMVASYQRVPAAMRDEIPDIVSEYATYFSSMGFSGEEAMGLITNAASRGKIEMDKIGDAIKEFGIRASDIGDTGAVAALETLGLAGEDVQNRLLAGGDTAKGAFDQVVDALLAVEDPAVQAEAAVALFGTPLEDLDKTKIPGFLAGMDEAAGAMAGFSGSSEQLADAVENSLGGRLNALKGTAQALASDVFMSLWDAVQFKLIPAFQSFGDWIQRNHAWLGPLAAAVGGAAAAVGIWVGAVKAWNLITKIATGLQVAFNAVMAANPIMLVVAAVAALAAGLTYFFMRTEKGREMWARFTDFLGNSWDWVVEKFNGFLDAVRPVWDGITGFIGTVGGAIKELWGMFSGDDMAEGMPALAELIGIDKAEAVFGVITRLRDALSTAWDVIKAGWDAFVSAIQWAWQSIIQPVFNAFVTAGKILVAVLVTAVISPILIAWNVLSDGISWAWENVIKPVWNAIQGAAIYMWANVLQPTWTLIQAAWAALGASFQWAWQNLIKVVWDAVAAAAQWLWNTILKPAFDSIRASWENLSNAIRWAYDNIIKPAWDAVAAAANWLWKNVLVPAFDAIMRSWENLSNAIRWAYDNIIKPAWDALAAAAGWLYDDVLKPTFSWISDRWSDMTDRLHQGYIFVKDTVFGGLKSALDTVKEWWRQGVDWLGDKWNELREKTAVPVRWVIDTVWNGGIRKAWNAVADLVGLDTLEPVTYNFATGGTLPGGQGVLPGYTPGRDIYEFREMRTGMRLGLSGGEPILRPEVGHVLGTPWVNGINAAARQGGVSGVRGFLGSFFNGGFVPGGRRRREDEELLPVEKHRRDSAAYYLGGILDLGNFAGGGGISTTAVQRAMEKIVFAKYPNIAYTSGTRPGGGNHGAGLATDWATYGAGGNSAEQLSLARDIAATYPGSKELIYDSPGWAGNLKNGRPMGAMDSPGGYSTAQAGPHHHHVHWAMDVPPTMPFGGGVFIGGSEAGGSGGGGFSIVGMVKGLWDAAVNKIGNFPGADTLGRIGKLPGAMLKKIASSAWDFVAEKARAIMSIGGGGMGPLGSREEISNMYRAQVEAAFRNQGEDPRADRVDALLRQIWTESKGDPNIAQQIVDVNGTGESAGVGLYQVIPTTWEGYRDPALSPDRRDPWAQHNFAVRYFRDRHGWNTGPGGVGRGHGWKSGGFFDLSLLAPTLFDKGGVWKSGTAGVNLSGADEYVFTNAAMRDFSSSSELLSLAAKELRVAFDGGDFGVSALTEFFGPDYAEEMVAAAGRLGELDRAMQAGWAAGVEKWNEEAPTQEDWVDAALAALGAEDSLTVGLIRRGIEFNDRVTELQAEEDRKRAEAAEAAARASAYDVSPGADLAAAPDVNSAPVVAPTPGPASGGGEGITVVVNLDGAEVLRERIDSVEDGQVEIKAELKALKNERRSVDTAGTVLLS